MSHASSDFSTPKIIPGKIYQNVYEKRTYTENAIKIAMLEKAWINKGELQFPNEAARTQAFSNGVFLLEIPKNIDISAADEFSRQFYMGSSVPPYGHFRDLQSEYFDDPLLGFHQRTNQIEQFLLERRFWKKNYPPEITRLGESLTKLSQVILCSVLTYIKVPEADWKRATGHCSVGQGAYHLTFNHYRPSHKGIGLSSHKDDGFLTILRTNSPGLEVNRKEQWESVPIFPNYFVINFGLSMEILSSLCQTPLSAIMHRVIHQTGDRSSFGHFTSSRCIPGKDQGIYRYVPKKGIERICGSRELINANDYEIYQGTESPKEH